jgi:hypothetical protein
LSPGWRRDRAALGAARRVDSRDEAIMTRTFCIAPLALLAFAPAAAHAGDLTYQLETSVASSYVSRGIVQYADRDVASSQNTASLRVDHVGPGALTLGTWSAVALSRYDNQPGTALELDLTASYAFNAGPIALTSGYAAYLFPSHEAGTPLDGGHEVFATASYDNPYVVPAVGVWIEPVRQQGAYVTLGGSHDFHYKMCTLSPAISLGAAAYRKYLGADQQATPHLNDVTAGLAGRVDLAGGTYAALRLSYALRTTPSDIMGSDETWGMSGRSTMVAVVAVGVAR